MGRGGRGSGMGGMRGGGISRGGGGIRTGGVGRNLGGTGGRAGRGSLAPPPRVNTPRPAAPPRGGMSGGAGFGLGLGTGLLLGGGRRRGFGWGRRGMMMGPGMGMGMGGHGMRRGGCGCSSIIMVIVVFVLLISVISLMNNWAPMGGFPTAQDSNITPSTRVRERLGAEFVNDFGPLHTDNLGWIDNSAQMDAGLRTFFELTGVRPHVYITDQIDGNRNPADGVIQEYASELYNRLFDDEGHLLLIFFEQEDDFPRLFTLPGVSARLVMDDEAQNILLDYILHYDHLFFATDGISEEQLFSNAFARAAERIMSEPPDNRAIWITLIVVAGVVLIVLILYNFWNKRRIQKNLEAEQTERILSQDLSTFSEDDASRLARQYEGENK